MSAPATPVSIASTPSEYDNTALCDEIIDHMLDRGIADLPSGACEGFVYRIVAIVENEEHSLDSKLIGLVEWVSGRKTQHQLETLDHVCPTKLLDYYEEHLVFQPTGEHVPADSWVELVKKVRTVFMEERDGRTKPCALLEMERGERRKESLDTVRRQCPQLLLQYYHAYL